MKNLRDESGNVLVLTAICMVILMGFAGMALDVGLAYWTRQKVQASADAGAVAAALSYYYGGTGSGAADTAVQQNGYPGTSTDTTVTYPVSFGGGSGFTQVTVTEPNPTNFMRVFGINSLNVSATAVAGPALLGSACVFFTGTSGGDDLIFDHSTRFNADCGIDVNSSVDVKDCGGVGKTTATYVAMTGTVNKTSCPGSPAFVQHAGIFENPWKTNDLTGPSLPGGCTSTWPGAIAITSANVSTYSTGSSGVVCFTGAVTLGAIGGTVTLPGSSTGVIYVFEGGVTQTTNSTVQFGTGSCTGSGSSTTCTTTAGAMMELACPPVGSCASSTFNSPGSASTLSIYAPTSGTMASNPYLNGIGIFQPYTNTNTLSLQFGSSTLNLDGYIYAPGAALDLQDQGGGVLATGIVASSLTTDSNANITISYDAANEGTTLDKAVTLVE